MKTLLLILVLAVTATAQQRHRSHDHPPPHNQALGVPHRVVRFTPRIFKDDTSRFYAAINDCNQVFRGFESPERLREMRREKRICLKEVRKRQR
jgi:hypothetical protein